jgi:hypothetical protein
MMRFLICFSVEVRRCLWLFSARGLSLPAFLVRHRSWKKTTLCGFCVCALLSAWGTNAVAATCNSTGGGNWNAIARWTCGHVPLATDDVFVLNTHTVTIDTAALAQSVTVNTGGILRFSTAAAHSLAVSNAGAQGNITIQTGATLDVDTTSNVTHTLSLVGNLSNSGTVNLAPDANSLCNTTFNRNGNQTVSGAGTFTFNRITVNMGATNANILDMQSNMTVPANFLTITNGTYKHSNTSNITPWTADPAIPASGGFWLNAAATVTTTGFNVTVNGGSLRISAGTMIIGNTDTTLLTLGNVATTLFQMDGGALTVTGGINSSATAGAGTFTMSGGTITLQTIDAGAVYTFLLGSATTLNWSGGTIIAVNGDNTTDDVDIRSPTQTITGGTLQLGSAATTSANDISYLNGAGGQLNVWNLVLASGPARNILMRSSTNILNDLTIQTANNLNPNAGLAINIGAGNTSGNWTNNGTFTQGTTTVTFTGTSATPAIGGTAATTFNNLTINKASNNLTINTTPTVNGTLTFTNGNIVTGANAVIIGTAATIATPSASSYVVGSIQKNYLAGAALSYFAGNDFPVGDATNFTPVNISAGTTTTAGSLTVSTLTPDHPQVTTPIASTGIDANNSVNRYWRFNNSGLTVGTAIGATFTFVAGDVDASASTANFIVQRYDGTNWNPTTLVAANPLNTQVSNVTLLVAGNNDFAIGDPLAGFNGGAVGAFNVFEATTPAGAVLGRLYTKLVGTAFTVSIVAVSNNTVNVAPLTTALTVDVIDASPVGGTLTAASDCRTTWVTVIQTQTVPAVVAWASGRINVTITAPVKAVRNARIRVTQGANVGCSTDNFTIRPTSFTITTSAATGGTAANQAGTSGAPAIKTGANFNLTASSVVGYDGTPAIDNTKVVGTPTPGTIGGVFAAASVLTGTATANTFYYSEVGNVGLATDAVVDSGFTSVDQTTDCVGGSTSFALSGGKYGCSIGSISVAVGSGFGRFIPDNFLVALISPQFGTLCASAPPIPPAYVSFTYVGQPFVYTTQPVITVTARNGTTNGLANATTTDYAGAYMKLTNASLTGKSYTSASGTLNVAGIPVVDPVIGYNGDGITVPVPTAGTATLTFNSGTGLFFTRTTQVVPFNADIALAINVIDADGVFYAGNPAAFGAATAGNGIAFSSVTAKQMRFGRLALGNAFGSELIDLPIPMETQYYNSSGVYITNVDDSCTTLSASNLAFAFVIGTPNLVACETSISPVTSIYFTSGKASAAAPPATTPLPRLTKPGAGNNGAVDITVNLGSASGNTCLAGTSSAATGANQTWLQWKWSGLTFDKNPTGRATFGVFKNADQFIYLRENF